MTATYLTATQAATRLGKSEKTIRRWIQEGRLTAHHPQGRANLLAIAESDIEQLATELAQYERPGTRDQDTGSQQLEQRVAALEARIRELERLLSVGTTAAAIEQPATRPYQRRAIEPTGLLERLPENSIPHFTFADRHGIKARTFLDHIIKGKVTVISHDKPNRPGEKSHWLSPEQQRAALLYWQANGTAFHECIISTCPCHAIVSGHDQDTSEQLQLEQEKP